MIGTPCRSALRTALRSVRLGGPPMAMTPRLEMRQGQALVMTPQLQQAIKLLQLSNVELQEFVSLLTDKVVRLISMILAIKLAYGIASRLVVVSVIALRLCGGDRVNLFFDEVFHGLDDIDWVRLIF